MKLGGHLDHVNALRAKTLNNDKEEIIQNGAILSKTIWNVVLSFKRNVTQLLRSHYPPPQLNMYKFEEKEGARC